MFFVQSQGTLPGSFAHFIISCALCILLVCTSKDYVFSVSDGALSSASSSVLCISRPLPSQSTPSLSREAQFYLGMALSQNTKKTYSSGMRQFYSFCSQTGIAPSFPISEDILINISVCMARSVQYSTIKNYLSAIEYYHCSHGYAQNISAFLLLQLILRGMKRSQGVNSKVRHNIAHIKFVLPSPKCQIYHQQGFLSGLGSNDTCLFLVFFLLGN